MKNPYLIGKTIYLRPLEREDAPLLVPWINDPDVTRTLEFYLPMNLRAEEAFIERLYPNPEELALGIVVKEGDQLIGVTGLRQIDTRSRHASFGIVIGEKSQWNQGYGTEATLLIVEHAFMTLNLNRVYLHVYAYNERGIRSYEKAGFKREGVLRQHHYHDGRYWDTLTMAILREDWDANRQSIG